MLSKYKPFWFVYLYFFVLFPIRSFSCEPGVNKLAKLLIQNLDVSQPTHLSAIVPRAAVDDTPKIFENGNIITMANGNLSTVGALVVRGDSIVYTGTAAGARVVAGTDAAIIDLSGKTLLPGFVEPHIHLILAALADRYLLDMSPLNNITTLDRAISAIQNVIDKNETLPGNWVVGYGYDPSRVANHSDLTLERLDSISKTIPIYILNLSGHIAYANTAAFMAAGITVDSVKGNTNYQTECTAPGVNCTLTGLLFESATAAVGAKVQGPNATTLFQFCISMLNQWASKGCTTVFDAGIGSTAKTDLAVMSALPASLIPQRARGALSTLVYGDDLSAIKTPPFNIGASNITITTAKFWADGSTQGFTAFVNDAYLDPPSYANSHGLKNFANATALQAAMDPWLKAGFQLMVHSNGDGSTDMVLDAYDAVFRANPNRNMDIMHRIEHFTVTRPDQLHRARNLGLGVSHTIGHVNYWGKTFTDYVLGSQRAERIHAVHDDEEFGLVWSMHSDAPVTDVNPLLYLKTATTRLLYPDGSGVLGTTQQVDLLSALKAITVNPARQLGMSTMIGTLEVGKKADMVVLCGDLMNTIPAKVDSVVVEQTWVGGKMVYQNNVTCSA